MFGLAKSLSHVSLFVSVNVTRGGGLKVGVDVIWPCVRRWERTLVKREERVCRPLLFFNAGSVDNLAEPISFCVACDFSEKPCRMTLSVNWSSG
jgi:hypothetical protein